MNGEERDMAQHLSSECFRGFLHEFVTKELAFLMDMVPASTFSRKDTSSNGQCVKPGDGDCATCGVDISEDASAHAFVHEHPLFADVEKTAQECKRVGLVQFLTNGVAVNLLRTTQPIKKTSAAPKPKLPNKQMPRKKKQKKILDWRKSKSDQDRQFSCYKFPVPKLLRRLSKPAVESSGVLKTERCAFMENLGEF